MKNPLPDKHNRFYWAAVQAEASSLNADGCSHVTEAYRSCCLEHDIHYRTHKTIYGDDISRTEADARFRQCMQDRSRFGKSSPMSWWRWAGVRLFGRKAWRD